MTPLSITTLSLAAVLATAALAPCRAETIDPGFLDRMAEERNAAKVPGRPITLLRTRSLPSRGACWSA